jgi:hypothetical protein
MKKSGLMHILIVIGIFADALMIILAAIVIWVTNSQPQGVIIDVFRGPTLAVEPVEVLPPIETSDPIEIAEIRGQIVTPGVDRQTPVASDTCVGKYGTLTLDRGQKLCLFLTNDTMVDGGDAVGIYAPAGTPGSGNAFLYGHNYGHVFGGLGEVNSFSISVNGGETYQYRVVAREIGCDYTNAGKGYPCSDFPGDPVVDMYKAITPSQVVGGRGVSLMTCAGTSIGGGDATHRLTVYAVQV